MSTPKRPEFLYRLDCMKYESGEKWDERLQMTMHTWWNFRWPVWRYPTKRIRGVDKVGLCDAPPMVVRHPEDIEHLPWPKPEGHYWRDIRHTSRGWVSSSVVVWFPLLTCRQLRNRLHKEHDERYPPPPPPPDPWSDPEWQPHTFEEIYDSAVEKQRNGGNRQITLVRARQVLGLRVYPTAEEIAQAFRRLSIEHHPDHGGDRQKFAEVARAYERLTRHLTREGATA